MVETTSNPRISVSLLGSGYAAVMLIDVTDEHGTYTDVQNTGFGRYRERRKAVQEAIQWAETDQIPLAKGTCPESFPFLRIAKEFSVPYEHVLEVAQRFATGEIGKISVPGFPGDELDEEIWQAHLIQQAIRDEKIHYLWGA